MMSLENSGESLTLLGLSKCKRLVVDKDKGLPLPAAEMLRLLVKPNKLFWLLPKLFVFVHWGQTEWEQYDTTRGGEPFASRWTLWHFPHHGAAHSQSTWQSVQISHIYPLLRASVFRGCPGALGQNTPFCLKLTKCASCWVEINPIQQSGYNPAEGGLCACKLDKMLPWESWPVCNHPNWRQPPAPSSDQDSEGSHAGYSGKPWEPMNPPTCLVSSKSPCDRRHHQHCESHMELVVGTHTIQTRYVAWVGHCSSYNRSIYSQFISSWFFLLQNPKEYFLVAIICLIAM